MESSVQRDLKTVKKELNEAEKTLYNLVSLDGKRRKYSQKEFNEHFQRFEDLMSEYKKLTK